MINIDMISGITDRLSRAFKLLEYKDEILNNVPYALLQEWAVTNMEEDIEEIEHSCGERQILQGTMLIEKWV